MTKADHLLAVEVGSTFTKLVLFTIERGFLKLRGRISAKTSIDEGDVSLTYRNLLSQLYVQYGVSQFRKVYLSSSAAGGLRMVVCGLTYNLTTKAALESALGAGGIVLESTAGLISERKAAQFTAINPNIILLCGGLDYGEEDVVLHNAEILAKLEVEATVIFAGNKCIKGDIDRIFKKYDKKVIISENVYPRVDDFHFHEVQEIVRKTFETEVVKAPGIEKIQQDTTPPIPTPLAVSYAAELLGKKLGGLVVLDVGGATTDVHSYVTEEDREHTLLLTLEPPIKRSVEGDLGVFHNIKNLLDQEESFTITEPTDVKLDLAKYARRACQKALWRHSGTKTTVHTGQSRVNVVYGRDLSSVKTLIGTGGALIYGFPEEVRFNTLLEGLPEDKLIPRKIENYIIDRRYLMSSLGLLSKDYPQEVIQFLIDNFALAD